MASIEKLITDQILYEYRKGNALVKELEYKVQIKEIDLEKRRVLVSWNGNPPKWWRELDIKKLRVKPKK